MTFKDVMNKELTSRGMFPNQAEEVINKHIEENEDESLQELMYQNVSSYPESMQKILWVALKHTAYEWIKINAPQAWFRPIFQYNDTELTEKMNQKNKI